MGARYTKGKPALNPKVRHRSERGKIAFVQRDPIASSLAHANDGRAGCRGGIGDFVGYFNRMVPAQLHTAAYSDAGARTDVSRQA